MTRQLKRIAPREVGRKGRGWHHDGGGLYLRVDPDGNRFFYFRWGAGGAKYLSLGPTHTISLACAREKARACRELLIDGRDPKAERATLRLAARIEAAKRVSFADCADCYFEAHQAEWRSEKHRRDWRGSIRTHAEPVFGSLPVGAIDTDLVLKALEPIWTTKTATAARVRERIEAVLDFARVRGLREGENPARWKGHLDHLLPAPGKVSRTKHHAALPYNDVPEFMSRLRDVPDTAARALEFTILTAVRAGEACGARWGEIKGDTWTIPAERMKGGKEHRVPLSSPALAVLARTPRMGELVFPSDRPGKQGEQSSRPIHTNSALLIAKELDPGTTIHGFRSAFCDWAAEQTNFPREACELALAHAILDRTEAAYRRGNMLDIRRDLMAAWGRHCSGEPASGVVVELGARRHG
jgi:integrase